MLPCFHQAIARSILAAPRRGERGIIPLIVLGW
jgi:hypothetical protein